MDRKIETIKKEIVNLSARMEGKRSQAMQAWRSDEGKLKQLQAAYDMGLVTAYADAVATLDSLIVFIDAYVKALEGEGSND